MNCTLKLVKYMIYKLSLKLFKKWLLSSRTQKGICYNEFNRQISGIFNNCSRNEGIVLSLQTECTGTAPYQRHWVDCDLRDIIIRKQSWYLPMWNILLCICFVMYIFNTFKNLFRKKCYLMLFSQVMLYFY